MSPLVITFLATELLIILIGTFFGFKRGLGKTVIRTVYLLVVGLLALLLSFFVVSICSDAIMVIARDYYPADLQKLIEASPELEPLIEAFASGLIFPIIFALLFGVFQLLSLIGFGSVAKKILSAIFPNKEQGVASKGTGAAVGFVLSIVVAAILLSPIFMTLSIYSSVPEEVLVAITSDSIEEAEIKSTRPSRLGVVTLPSVNFEMPPFLFVSKLMTGALTGFETPNHERTNVLAEVPIIMHIADGALATVDVTNEHGGDNVDVFTNACSLLSLYVDESPFVKELSCDVLRGFGTVLERGDTIFNMTLSNDENSPMTPVVNSFMHTVSETTTDTVKGNLITLFGKPNDEFVPEDKKEEASHISGVASDDYHNIGMVSAFMHMNAEQTEETSEKKNDVLSKAFITMADNDAMHEVFQEVTIYASNVINEKATDLVGENTQVVYEGVASNIEETITATADATTEEKVEIVKDILDSAIEKFDVDIEDWESSVLATCAVKEFLGGDYVDENGVPTVSASDVMAFFGISEDQLPDWGNP